MSLYLPIKDAILIQNYYMDTIAWERTVEEIHEEPYPEQIWMWWTALAHYKINHDYERLEDAPEGLEWITVMGEERKNYAWRGGKYAFVQTMTKDTCYKIYG